MTWTKEHKKINDDLFKNGFKRCSVCNEIKNTTEFSNNKKGPYGLRCSCRLCSSKDGGKSLVKKNDKLDLLSKGLKECSVCKQIKGIEEFNLCKYGFGGRKAKCKYCRKRSRENNKDYIKLKRKDYYFKNRDVIKDKVSNYYYKNKEKVLEYREKNRDIINEKISIYRKTIAKYNSYVDKLPISDKPTLGDDGNLLVSCKQCASSFYPTNIMVDARIQALKGNYYGESNFYCSDECKKNCKVYGFNSNNTDPDSVLYVPRLNKQYIRGCQKNQKNQLKQIQMDIFGYNFCEKCGEERGVVELHHTLPVAKFGNDSINPAGHILLCSNCHKEETKICNNN